MSKSNKLTTDVKPACISGLKTCPLYKEIARLEQEIKSLREQVNIDPLTHLYNRRYFTQSIYQESERTQRTGLPTSLVLIDIDFFKKINDVYGHQQGDQVLEYIAKSIDQNCRKIDIPCRYGGEEFAIILPSTPLNIAVQVSSRLREIISSLVIETQDGEKQTTNQIKITASFGIASMEHQKQCSVEQLIELADKHLYLAKESGRNCLKYPDINTKQKNLVSQDELNALFD